jgi:hypothetical protein
MAKKELVAGAANEVQLKGRLSRDPKVIKNLALFPLAIHVERADGLGGMVSETHYLDCSFQCKEAPPEWLKSGVAIQAKGHLVTWTPKARVGEIHKNAAGQDMIPFPKIGIRLDNIVKI